MTVTQAPHRQPRFVEPLHEVFTEDSHEWFVGLDRMIEQTARKWETALESFHDFPISEVDQIDNDHYVIRVHAPGYDKSELSLHIINDDELVIAGTTSHGEGSTARRSSFRQHFLLAETMSVDSARYVDDTLTIEVSFPKEPGLTEASIPIL